MDQGHLAEDTCAVRVDCLNSVATLTLDHPARHNALTFEMLAAIPLIVRELEADPAIRVIVLTGAGKNFSSGADIRDLDRVLHEGPPGGVLTAAEEALARTHIPTIAAIRGYCFGGGWQLASACDVRLAAADTRIAITPAKLGIMYPMTGLRRLLQLVGPAVTKRLLYSGESIGADRAESYGMADKAKNLDAEVAKLVDNISRRSRLTISGTGEVLPRVAGGRKRGRNTGNVGSGKPAQRGRTDRTSCLPWSLRANVQLGAVAAPNIGTLRRGVNPNRLPSGTLGIALCNQKAPQRVRVERHDSAQPDREDGRSNVASPRRAKKN
ncbi:enoyl-CoA hydratase/isomerase family protein [Pseudarthrobacter sp. B4EP4b]|uniref:enoyl-CoA hydratase/isomerase family protein n=1 Tax=Pseudarthrobacter sp. B4EP4b TaxID=2590664 RepID=UPI0015EF04DA